MKGKSNGAFVSNDDQLEKEYDRVQGKADVDTTGYDYVGTARAIGSDDAEERVATWDVFRTLPEDPSAERNEDLWNFLYKVARAVTICVIFVCILGCAALAKGAVLLAAAQLRPQPTVVCQTWSWADVSDGVKTACMVTPDDTYWVTAENVTCLTPEPPNGTSVAGIADPRAEYPMCISEKVRWLWCLFILLVIPYLFVFLRNLWLVLFKSKKTPDMKVLCLVLLVEIIHTIGMSLLVFLVLPLADDSTEALGLLTAVAFIPSVLRIFCRPSEEKLRPVQIVLDVLSMLSQCSALIVIPVLQSQSNDASRDDLIWAVPTSLFMISIAWWENFIDEDSRLGFMKEPIMQLRQNIRHSRTKIYLVVSVVKIGVALAMMVVCASRTISTDQLFNFNFGSGRCHSDDLITIGQAEITTLEYDWVWIIVLVTVSAFVGHFCARTAAKVHMQRSALAAPMLLVTPLLFAFLLPVCEYWNQDPCQYAPEIPAYLFWKCYPVGGISDLFVSDLRFMIIIWWLSLLWITRHIWFPEAERLAKTERLFALPLYDNIIFDPWVQLNRWKRDDAIATGSSVSTITAKGGKGVNKEEAMELSTINKERLSSSATPLVYICATMWHETELEMILMLKSIFRLDIDQCARKNAIKYLGVVDPDYYEFEAHIFFDDAMEGHDETDQTYRCNEFVRKLVSVVNTAACAVHEANISIPSPSRIPTPYGGRLVWAMPGGNKIYVHLKDKAKIRHKKRWSQVMYMYYFLAFRLWAHVPGVARKQVRADNTFLLALDGDVDFQPRALQLLVDLMRKDEKMGAACGRIHPTGSGPMVWYQKFEYALGHWMQKATEHVLGCVLCSPGCFSLFRGSALMDDNVMNKYTTTSTEAKHFVQYDQGEDRWLCTLLLQQGYRVEYSAASDSYTFAPEGFNEFYNQRRRWMPSTMANIMDLLLSWKQTVNNNENLSMLYIVYQAALLISSLLGTGTIFLMIVGALSLATGGVLSAWASLGINIVPVLFFIIVCFKAKPTTQVNVAAVLTTMYALLQMLVLVGIFIEMADSGVGSPSAVFFFYVGGTFILAAILHPQEATCVIHGFIYFLAIPSMYMLLMMYALTNLHVVSWGTREVTPTKTEQQKKAEAEAAKEQKSSNSDTKIAALLARLKVEGAVKGFRIAMGNLFQCVCCVKKTQSPENARLEVILHKLEDVEATLEMLQKEKETPRLGVRSLLKQDSTDSVRSTHSVLLRNKPRNTKADRSSHVSFKDFKIDGGDDDGPTLPDDLSGEEGAFVDAEMVEGLKRELVKRDELINPYWMEDKGLGTGPPEALSKEECFFFQDLIEQYLKPLVKDKVQEERVARDLLELRNQASFAYFLMNGLFVVTIFILQLNVESINVPWPWGKPGAQLKLEPIGFLFLIFFGIVMLLQTVGMIVHRTGTFLHIIASAKLNLCSRKDDESIQDSVELAKALGSLVEEEAVKGRDSVRQVDKADEGDDKKTLGRRLTVHRLASRPRTNTVTGNMNDAFQKRLEELNSQLNDDSALSEIEKKLQRSKSRKTAKSMRAVNRLRKTGATVKTHDLRRDLDELKVTSGPPPPPARYVSQSEQAQQSRGSIVSLEDESKYETVENLRQQHQQKYGLHDGASAGDDDDYFDPEQADTQVEVNRCISIPDDGRHGGGGRRSPPLPPMPPPDASYDNDDLSTSPPYPATPPPTLQDGYNESDISRELDKIERQNFLRLSRQQSSKL